MAVILAARCLLVAFYLIVRGNANEFPQQNPETTPVSTKAPVLAPLATIEGEEEPTSNTTSNLDEALTTNAQSPSAEHSTTTNPEESANNQITGRVNYSDEAPLSQLQPAQATPVS